MSFSPLKNDFIYGFNDYIGCYFQICFISLSGYPQKKFHSRPAWQKVLCATKTLFICLEKCWLEGPCWPEGPCLLEGPIQVNPLKYQSTCNFNWFNKVHDIHEPTVTTNSEDKKRGLWCIIFNVEYWWF